MTAIRRGSATILCLGLFVLGGAAAGALSAGTIGLALGVLALALALDARRLARRRGAASASAEERLHASEAKFEGILAIAADAIISVDETQRIVHFNQGAEHIFGYAAAEAIGQPLEILLPERFRAMHAGHVMRFAAGAETARLMGHRREVSGLRKGGEEFPAEASISRFGAPGQRLFTVVLRDATERKRAAQTQQFLAEAGAVLARTLDFDETLRIVANLPVPLLADWCMLDVVDRESADEVTLRCIVSSDAPGRVVAPPALERRTVPWSTPSRLIGVLRGGEPYLWREHRDEPASRDFLLPHELEQSVRSLMIVPLLARDRVVGALTLMSREPGRDGETDLALARELALRAAFAIDNARLYQSVQAATRARDEVLGVVSHDLRNPLSVISMCTRVLTESPPADGQARRDMLSTIGESVEWMHRLIQDLLDVSNIEAGRLSIESRREDVLPIVERALQIFAQAAAGRRLTLRADVATGLPSVIADAGRLLQVLSNLIDNAVKFVDPGGVITVGAERRGGEIVFRVTDTGRGIAPEHLAHIFDRYWQARGGAQTRGSGLGLTIARGIVDAHGGRIRVESVPGHGTTFFFTLPIDSSTDPEQPAKASVLAPVDP